MHRNKEQNERRAAYLVDPANPGRDWGHGGSFREEYVRSLGPDDAQALEAHLRNFADDRYVPSANAFNALTLLNAYEHIHGGRAAAELREPVMNAVFETLSRPHTEEYKTGARQQAALFLDEALLASKDGDSGLLKRLSQALDSHADSGKEALFQEVAAAWDRRPVIASFARAGFDKNVERLFLGILANRIRAGRHAEDRHRLGYGDDYARESGAQAAAMTADIRAFLDSRTRRMLTRGADLDAVARELQKGASTSWDVVADLLSKGIASPSIFERTEAPPPLYEDVLLLKHVDEIAGYNSHGKEKSTGGWKVGYIESLGETELKVLSQYLDGAASGRYQDWTLLVPAFDVLSKNDNANGRSGAEALAGPLYLKAVERFSSGADSTGTNLKSLMKFATDDLRTRKRGAVLDEYLLPSLRSMFQPGKEALFKKYIAGLYGLGDTKQFYADISALGAHDPARYGRDIETLFLGFLAIRLENSREADAMLKSGHGYHHAQDVNREAVEATRAIHAFAVAAHVKPSEQTTPAVRDWMARQILPAGLLPDGLVQSELTSHVDWWKAAIGFDGLQYDSGGRRAWGDNVTPAQLFSHFSQLPVETQDAYNRMFARSNGQDAYGALANFLSAGDPKLAVLFERSRPEPMPARAALENAAAGNARRKPQPIDNNGVPEPGKSNEQGGGMTRPGLLSRLRSLFGWN